MAESCNNRPLGTNPFERSFFTPGPCGHNDAGAPDLALLRLGNTPGPLGINDYTDPNSNYLRVKSHDMLDEVEIPTCINMGMTAPTPKFLVSELGAPRQDYTQECQPVTNITLVKLIHVSSIGPFKVQGLVPAINSLLEIFKEIRSDVPSVYNKLGTAGMLCCRKQRGSNRISSHSWGTAIDLTIAGKLDVRGNNKVQYGLTLIAPIFNRHGWVWGAGYRIEDAMHFEVSMEKIMEWKASGQLKSKIVPGGSDDH